MENKAGKIKCIWQVEGDDNEYDSEEEAILAAEIMEAEDIYIERYHRKNIIKYICKHFVLLPRTGMKAGDGQEDPIAAISNLGAYA